MAAWIPTVVLTLIILYFLYVVGSVALVPVLASFALAYLLNPVVSQGERLGLSRSIATAVALVLVTLAAVAFLAFVIPDLWEQSTNAVQKILRNFTSENAARQRETLRRYSPALDRMAGSRIEQFLRNPAEAIGSPALLAAGGLSGFLSTAVASLDLLIVPFFVFYILIDFGTWRDSMEDLIPPRFATPSVGSLMRSGASSQPTSVGSCSSPFVCPFCTPSALPLSEYRHGPVSQL